MKKIENAKFTTIIGGSFAARLAKQKNKCSRGYARACRRAARMEARMK